MNASDTADIVRRIVGTWPMSPKGALWTEAIGDLDYGPALAAYTQMRDELDEQRISIARFKATYRAIADHGNTARAHPSEQPADDGRTMSFHEFIGHMSAKAAAGDRDAEDVLAEWDRALRRMPEFGLSP